MTCMARHIEAWSAAASVAPASAVTRLQESGDGNGDVSRNSIEARMPEMTGMPKALYRAPDRNRRDAAPRLHNPAAARLMQADPHARGMVAALAIGNRSAVIERGRAEAAGLPGPLKRRDPVLACSADSDPC